MKLDKRQILQQVESGGLEVDQAVELLLRLGTSDEAGPLEHVYYEMRWEPAAAPAERLAPGQRVLLLIGDREAPVDALRAALTGHEVVSALQGTHFRQLAGDQYELDLASEEHGARLLAGTGFFPTHVLHLWRGGPATPPDASSAERELEAGVCAAFSVVKALLAQSPKQDIVFLSACLGPGGAFACAAVAGFLAVAAQENPRLQGKAIHLSEASATTASAIASLLATELTSLSSPEAELRYGTQGRQLRRLTELVIPESSTPGPLRQGGVYLITGGAGGLGLLFARHLVATAGARLVLTGRSTHPSAQQAQALRELEALGGQVLYCPADVTVQADMERAVRLARERFGQLDGVLHAAGVIEDAFILRKAGDSFRRVLAPKTRGVLALDQATRQEALDFFALFSSTATVLGRAGQGDYAAANHYMDEFAATRNGLVAEGQRSGHTVSIAWPLWQGGGMNVSQADQEALERIAGMAVMPAGPGFAAFIQALRSGRSQVAVLYGQGAKIRGFLERHALRKSAPASGAPRASAPRDRAELARGAEEYLLELISRETRLPRQRIDVKQGLDAIGLDSMLINRLNLLLEDHFGALSKTLFFEYQSIRELAAYFSEQHAEALAALLSPGPAAEAPPAPVEPTTSPAPAQAAALQQVPAASGDIAIIGLSGRYPDAEDLEEFWENLTAGRNSVGQVPRERWELSRYPGLELNARERQGLQWGAFLREVDTFDPLFFNIAPRDAEVMDPQERLFLETAWSALEDSGYSRQELQRTSRQGDETPVGVFAGVTFGQYQSIGVEEWGHGNYISPGSSFWSIANRLSYVLNVHGPSMPVDTACSASLTAVHMACESLRRGDCRVAIAGGVNLNIHPAKYLALARLKFLSTEGKCRAFGDGGDGYVPGEGVGAVVLKPLAQAEADGDHIYAVIKGSTVNHGGKTNGYTVPNPNAQASLVSRALRGAGVDARTISYVEAHGTGTALGDPIEITGLSKAFREYTRDTQFCAIGSVKTNVGHLESAAGIASLTKVLLQLEHKQLVPSLHAETLNRNIDFGATPFFVQRELAPWPSPTGTASDGRPSSLPRRAAISSFGAGGANAHVILEEYVPSRTRSSQGPGPELVVLSAKSPARLRAYAGRLRQHLRRLRVSGRPIPALGEIAYTLQVGREALEERLALVVSSVDELLARLEELEQGRSSGPQVLLGRVPEERTATAEVERSRAEQLIHRRDWTALARLWVEGHYVPWGDVYRGRGQRVPLPTYPFERKRFWVPLSDRGGARGVPAAPASHPLLGSVVPSLHGAVFERSFRPQEPLLRDHHVRGRPILAGVAQLEMVRAAAEAAGAATVASLHDVVWLSTVAVSGDSTTVRLTLTPREDGVSYEVTVPGTSGTCARGRVRFQGTEPRGEPPRVDLSGLQARCQQRIGKAALYAGFRSVGLEYGPSFQCVEQLWVQGHEVLGELRLAPESAQELAQQALPPTLVDAALHTLQGLVAEEASNGAQQTLIPFSVAEVQVYGRLPARCFAYAQLRENNRESGVAWFNVAILDESGRCLVLFKDFSARRLRVAHSPAPAPEALPVQAPAPAPPPAAAGFFYQPCWKEQPQATPEASSKSEAGTVLIFTHPRDCGLGARLAALYGEHRVIQISLEEAWSAEDPRHLRINHRDPGHYAHVLTQVPGLSAIYFLGGMQSKRYSAHDLRQLERMEERGVLSLLRLARGLAAHPPGAISLKVVTNDVYRVRDGDAAFNPFASALVGFTKVLSREFRQLQVSCIDVAKAELDAGEDTALGVVNALAAEPGAAALQCALRDGRRFVQGLEAVELPESSPPALSFAERGVYLILGGAGGLGLAVAEHLARRYRARLVLVGRSALREEAHRRIQSIQAAGGEVLYLRADLCDVAAMRDVVLQTRARFGSISGVIHSALVLQDGVIGRMTEEQLRAALAPKARGLAVLHHVLEAEPLDFIACFSSALSFTSAPGQANYAAASTFEDCFALYLEHRLQRPVRLFNWGFWGDTGIVATDTYRERMARQGVEALTREEGLLAFERVMAGRATQISPIKLQPELLEFFRMDATQIRAPYPETFPSVITPAAARLDTFIQKGPDIPGNAALLPLEQHGRLLLLQAFQEMGVLRAPGERHVRDELRERLHITPTYTRLYEAMLDILAKGGFVRRAGDSIEATSEVRSSQVTPQGVRAHRESLLARLPDGRAFLELLEACVTALPEVLTGRKSHMEVMFPGGSKALVENIYKGNRRSDYFNDLVCQSILAVLEKRLADSGQEKISLLEIGAGTGGTSGRVFEAIEAHGARISYDYTDISRGFATHGQRTFGRRFPFASFKVLDVEKDGIAQGFKPGAYDIVLATNVLHATRDMRNTLRQAKVLMKTNGVLVINEVTVVQDFTTLTFGLTNGWWLFEDAHLRLPHSPLLGLKEWRAVLEGQGFRKVLGFGLPRGRPEVDGQNIILAESDGWLDSPRKQPLPPAPEPRPAFVPPAPVAAEPRASAAMLSNSAQRWAPPPPPRSAPVVAQPPPAPAAASQDDALREHTLALLQNTLADVLKMAPAELEPGATFESYGVDSLVGMDFLDKLEGEFTGLPKTLLFEHITLAQLTAHFLRAFPEVLRRKFGGASVAAPRPGLAQPPPLVDAASLFGAPLPAATASSPASPVPAFAVVREERAPARAEGIAIIGVSGRYPQAEDLRAFWQNLRQGRSAFSEVPPERWNHRAYHDDTGERPGTTYHRWGAFLADVDKFDPLFFGISPREAQLMDPQERLFLETAWATLEDAGWTSARLNRSAHAQGGSGVGVFVGVMYGPYQLLAAEEWARGNRVDAQSAYWSIPNRVSYVFDFHGPSLAVDTACSSSLTAIHLACESIRRGECRAALAGGVNLLLHPSHHVGLGKMSMLSRDGSCRAFGEGASGFVAGEGVGAVLLKPLSDAIRDGDRIYGVIQGSAVNTNGRTNGYTVPSPTAQAELIETALRRAGVDPRTVSYVEAQAVGSALADPIEVSGLTKAFERFTAERGFCALGSLKPNIGHLEAASGVAQLTKVLLQLQHGQLAPSLGSERLNPYIDFENSPFYVQRQAAEWPAPGDAVTGRRLPRRAAVSSFGAGGANAHLLIEEYVAPRRAAVARDDGRPQLITLSAKRPERLAEQARRLRDFLSEALSMPQAAPVLADVAYTLQTGREAMGTRLAVLVRELPALVSALDHFLAGREAPGLLFTGTVKKASRPAPLPADSVRQALAASQLERIASAWASGAEVDWELLHEGQPPQRLALPTYPFARERYWLDVSAQPVALPAESSTPSVVSTSLPAAPAPLEARGESTTTTIPTSEVPLPPRTQDMHVTEDRPLLRQVQEVLMKSVSEILGVRAEDVELDEHVSDYGFDSISLTKFAALLNRDHGLDVSPTIFFEHATLGSFADYLVREHRGVLARALLDTPAPRPQRSPEPPAEPTREAPSAKPRATAPQPPVASPAPGGAVRAAEPIAIIGMAGRFPGSPDLTSYWENLLAGRDLVTEIPSDRFDWRDIYGDPQKDPTKTPSRWGGFLREVDRFDALFFSISPREARSMDPQQRLFLETVWHALEDAGYPPSQLAGSATGLFVGVAGSEYSHLLAQAGAEIDGQAATGNAHSILANRVSFLLDLHGPSEPVDTACSSSLVAVHRAVSAIQSGECDMAIAGGVNVLLTPAGFLAFGKSGMLASDGRCKTFDQRADGYVRGEGVGAVLLKPLSRALADGDHIYAVVKGSAVNHGGRANSLTAPNPNAQADLVMRAVRRAGVAPESIGYIEAHGTGTSLGDPIEVNGLKRAFRELGLGGTEHWRRKSCGLGTVKTNIGHLETAAGIAGLIKVLLSLRHKRLPPVVHFQKLNEYIALEDSPFYVVDRAQDWEPARDERGAPLPRRAGISSFGFGGVNVHLVLEEHEAPPEPEELSTEGEAILLSARSPERLKAYAEGLLAFLEAENAAMSGHRTRLADLAYTLQAGREHMSNRLALFVRGRQELLEKLRAFTRDGAGGADMFTGDDQSHRELVSLFGQDGEDRGYFEGLARQGNFRKLAALWAKGFSIPWVELRPRGSLRRVPLPTYPFARERYWLAAPASAVTQALPPQAPAPTPAPEPVRQAPQPVLEAPREAPSAAAAPATPPRAEAPPAQLPPARAGESSPQGASARIRAVFAEFIGIDEQAVDADREFTSYGIDSIAGLRVMQRIQQLYGEHVPMLAIIEHPTLHRFTHHLLRNYVKEAAAPAPVVSAHPAPQATQPPPERPRAPVRTEAPSVRNPEAPRTTPEVRLVPFQPSGPEAPLFGLPGDWGDVGWLVGLAQHLSKTQPVYGLELVPAPSGVECGVEALAAECVRVLLNARASGPYRLAAYGLGAGTAVETARRLQQLGHEVSELLLLAPAVPRPVGDGSAQQQAGDSASVLTYLGNALGQLWQVPGVLRYDALPRGDFTQQRKAVVDFLTRSAACPIPAAKLDPWLDSAARQYALGLLALSRYRPRPLSKPVQALVIRPQELTPGAGDAYTLPRPAADTAGTAADWQGLLGGPLRVLEAPHHRFSLLSLQGLTWVKDQALTPRAPEPSRQSAHVLRALPGQQNVSSIVVPINKNGAQRASFWVHTLLGDVSYGLNLSRHLGIDYPVLGIEQFDMDGNVFLLPTIEEMASRYIDALRATQPTGPYVLGGYSFGGIVAFEMAYQLGQRGEQVSDLVLIDSLMPGTEVFNAIDTSSFVTDDFSIMSLILIGNSFGTRWHADRYLQLDELTGRSRQQQIEQVARHLRDRSRTALSFEEILQLVRRNYETITSNNDALNLYRPKGALDPRVNATLFHATLGFVGPNNPNNIPEVKIRVDDRTNGFGRYVSNSFRIVDLPADHYTICTDEFIRVVAEKTRVAITPMRVLSTERAS